VGVDRSDLLQGTLDMLILKIVALGPVHGYGFRSASSKFRAKSCRSARLALSRAASAGERAGYKRRGANRRAGASKF